MPSSRRDVYATMLNRLVAEEELRMVNAVAAGVGNITRTYFDELVRRADMGPRVRKMNIAALRAAKVDVVFEDA